MLKRMPHSSEKDLLEKLESYDLEMILLRCGSRGLYTIFDNSSVFIHSLESPEGVIDVTGCGNTCTAGAFAAKCLGDNAVMAAVKGNISSNYNLRQKGPYPYISSDICHEALLWAYDIYKEYM